MPSKKSSRAHQNRLSCVGEWSFGDHIVDLAWSPDSRLVLAAEISGPIQVVDTVARAPLTTLKGHGFGTMAIAWHPRGDRIASSGQDGKVRIWDTTLWQERAVLEGGASWVEHLAYQPGGTLLASAAGKKVRLWDDGGNLIREWADFPATILDLAWQPSGKSLAVACYGGVRLCDPEAEQPVRTLSWKGAPLKLAWSPNSRVLAHGNQDGTVHFWNMATPDTPLQMSGYEQKVRALCWDYSSRFLATNGGESVYIWDCAGKGPEGSKPQMLPIDMFAITALSYQHRSFLIAATSESGRVGLFQPANMKMPFVGEGAHRVPLSVLAWDFSDKRFAVGSEDGRLFLYKVS